MAQQTFTAANGQSIYDVCINCYGTLDQLYKLLQDNNIAGIDVPPAPGQVYVYDDTLMVNQSLQQQNQLNGIRYATL